MNVKWWFNIADSTVYSTLKTLEKKEYIIGTTEKSGICQTVLFIAFLKRGKTNLYLH